MGDIDYSTRVSVNIRIKHVFSMNFTHFHEPFLQQMLFNCSMPNGPNYANTEKPRVDRVFMAKQCYIATFIVKTILDHACSIE